MSKILDEFNKIQSLPYHISVDGEPGCDCEDKSKMFVDVANSLGFDARTRVGLFSWADIALPEKVSGIEHDKTCSHFFVEIFGNDGESIFVDPTWNDELTAAGLVVAKWDGIGSTDLAVPCFRILSYKEGLDYQNKIDYKSDIARNGDFYSAINSYCDGFLKKGDK